MKTSSNFLHFSTEYMNTYYGCMSMRAQSMALLPYYKYAAEVRRLSGARIP